MLLIWQVEKNLAPLSETIVWVELTRYQKMCYRAVLEGKRELLVGGVSKASMPALNNLQMELRKCCNHPYLIKGVETADTAEAERLGYVEALLRASGKLMLLDKLLPKLKAEGHRVLVTPAQFPTHPRGRLLVHRVPRARPTLFRFHTIFRLLFTRP